MTEHAMGAPQRRRAGRSLLASLYLTERLASDAEQWVREEHPEAEPLDPTDAYDATWLCAGRDDLHLDLPCCRPSIMPRLRRRYVRQLPRLTRAVAAFNAMAPWPGDV